MPRQRFIRAWFTHFLCRLKRFSLRHHRLQILLATILTDQDPAGFEVEQPRHIYTLRHSSHIHGDPKRGGFRLLQVYQGSHKKTLAPQVLALMKTARKGVDAPTQTVVAFLKI